MSSTEASVSDTTTVSEMVPGDSASVATTATTDATTATTATTATVTAPATDAASTVVVAPASADTTTTVTTTPATIDASSTATDASHATAEDTSAVLSDEQSAVPADNSIDTTSNYDSHVSAALPSGVTAAIRTATPLIVSAVATVALKLGVAIPGRYEDYMSTGLPMVLAYLYWAIAHLLEKKFPNVPWLGTTRKPLYTAPKVTALSASSLVYYKGKRFSPRMKQLLVELDRITPNISIVFAQGGWNAGGVAASAGTHDEDAVDISVVGHTRAQIGELVVKARRLGLAAWYRPYNWDGANGGAHIHAVPNRGTGMYLSSGAYAQTTQYREGLNGLANRGRDNQLGATSLYYQRTFDEYLSSIASSAVTTTTATQTTKAAVVKRWGKVTVDGIWTMNGTSATTRALQCYLSTNPKYTCTLDGLFGSQTCKALQAWLGKPETGSFDTGTAAALQHKVGVTPDGVFGEHSIKALQVYLNDRCGY